MIVEAVVLNPGPDDRRYAVQVLGSAESWTSLEPPSVTVPAGGRALVALHLHPPRAPHVRSGATPVGLLVSAPEPGEHATTEGVLEIARFRGLDVRLFPSVRHGRSGTFELLLRNDGNEVVRATVAGRGDAEDLTVSCSPETLAVFPGGEAVSQIRVRSPRQLWREVGGARSFRVVVHPTVDDPIGVRGALITRSATTDSRDPG
ncbi:hypothetical protein [Actinomycetospora termitidis]|uniref:Uncharacterized protein n=1 Tax=Actinomycetospora termitidis TaxID=3053470 RepID=A0ABT7M7B1_9PSEU|nr:hypothetical protein [Actinomycetospora sp. Odt1-22]MDL5156562.1 hypothetical protein [Actinomycetospora sp. Odt1-22]